MTSVFVYPKKLKYPVFTIVYLILAKYTQQVKCDLWPPTSKATLFSYNFN